MNLKQIFGINDTKNDFRYSLSVGIALIFPQLILISYTLVVGRLFIAENTGIFSNEFLNNSILEVGCNLILVVCLFAFLNIRKTPIIISILIAAVISRVPNIIIGNQIEFISMHIFGNFLLIILFQYFLNRFNNPLKGLVIAFLIAVTIIRLMENFIYAIHEYKNFGKEALINNFENGEIIRKLSIDIASGLILTLLFGIGLMMSFKLLIDNKIKAL